MRRREFITLIGGAAVWPLPARAQPPALPVVGFLSNASADAYEAIRLQALREALTEAGYAEGPNLTIEYRWADEQNKRLRELATDLVRRGVAVIIAASDSAALAAKAVTSTIPIVFSVGNDPVAEGLVASLNRPGGNLTGVTNLNVELMPKRLEVLHELVPPPAAMVLLVNPNVSNASTVLQETQAAARSLGRQIEVLRASSANEIDAAFTSLLDLHAGALVIGADALFSRQSAQLGALAARHGVPAIFQTRDFAVAGGLMSYGNSPGDQARQVGIYVARILKGEKPADLPVQRATKAELIINLKTAKALGITVPLSLLGRADEVIE